MKASIDVPNTLLDVLQAPVKQQGSSVQTVILEAPGINACPRPSLMENGQRLRLPLIRSKRPGSLPSLSNADIDGILG